MSAIIEKEKRKKSLNKFLVLCAYVCEYVCVIFLLRFQETHFIKVDCHFCLNHDITLQNSVNSANTVPILQIWKGDSAMLNG